MQINAPSLDQLTDNDRKRFVRIKAAVDILAYNVYFENLKGQELLDFLTIAFEQARRAFEDPQKYSDIRPINIFLSGLKNTGKTTILHKFENATRQVAMEEGREYSDYEILIFSTPVRVTFKRMFASILEKLGTTIEGSALRGIHTDRILDLIIEELKNYEVKVLVLDDIENLLSPEIKDIEEKVAIFEGFKRLTNESQTRIVLAGTPSSAELFSRVDWVDERFKVLILPPWKIGTEFGNLLFSIYNAYKDGFPDWDLVYFDEEINELRINGEIAHFLHNLTGGRLGRLIQTIKYGAVNALLNNRTNIIKDDYESIFTKKFSYKNGKIIVEEKKEKKEEKED